MKNLRVSLRPLVLCLIASLSGCATRDAALQLPPFKEGSETYEFRLGDFRAVALLDGTSYYRADAFFLNVPPDRVSAALERHEIRAPDRIPSTFTCLALLDTRRPSTGWTLLDTGFGSVLPTSGRLVKNLEGAGIAPGDITTVVITHAHPDHVAGIANAAGATYYPNAHFVISESEWRFWNSEEAYAKQPKSRVEIARKQFAPVRNQIRTVASDAEIAPGIRFVDTRGHTPGHTVVEVESRGTRLIFISDLVLHQIHIEEPDWRNNYDLDPALADEARRRIIGGAAEDGSLILAYHFVPFPSLGYVRPRGKGWEWLPVPKP